MSWADVTDDEFEERLMDSDPRKCVHCGEVFASRNALYIHLRSVGHMAEKEPVVLRSCTDGLATTDEDSPGGSYSVEHPAKGPHAETRRKRRKPQHVRHLRRAGWALDLAATCSVTGRRWDCRRAEDRAWARRLVWKHKPQFRVVCPPCTLFSSLQISRPMGFRRRGVLSYGQRR